MNIHESAEDYLEMILMLNQKNDHVRSIDIANALGVTKPSVSFAMKRLRENGYINMDESNLITLTDKGMTIAQHIYERHQVITRALSMLGVPEEIAKLDACKIEHDISSETFQAIREHICEN